MSKSHQANGSYERHQHPLVFIVIFLAVALGALALITANHRSSGTGSGDTPGPPNAMDCPRGVPPEGIEISDIEGQQLPDVEAFAASKDMTVRVVMEDGQSFPQTMDFRPDRINTQVEAGVVTRYCGNY